MLVLLAVLSHRSFANDVLPLFAVDGGSCCGRLSGSLDLTSARYTFSWVEPGGRTVHILLLRHGTVMVATIHPRRTKTPLVEVDGVPVGLAGVPQALAFLAWRARP